MTITTLIAIAGMLVSIIGAALVVAVSWGRMGAALTDLAAEIERVRTTLDRWGERLGDVEGDIKVLHDRTAPRARQQTLSGR